jgi:hypothetical protein
MLGKRRSGEHASRSASCGELGQRMHGKVENAGEQKRIKC